MNLEKILVEEYIKELKIRGEKSLVEYINSNPSIVDVLIKYLKGENLPEIEDDNNYLEIIIKGLDNYLSIIYNNYISDKKNILTIIKKFKEKEFDCELVEQSVSDYLLSKWTNLPDPTNFENINNINIEDIIEVLWTTVNVIKKEDAYIKIFKLLLQYLRVMQKFNYINKKDILTDGEFQVICAKYGNNEVVINYFAYQILTEMFQNMSLEQYIHSKFNSKEEVMQYGSANVILDYISSNDKKLYEYVLKHLDLINAYIKDVEGATKDWDTYNKRLMNTKLEIIEDIISRVYLMDRNQIFYYLGKDLDILSDVEKYLGFEYDEDDIFLYDDWRDSIPKYEKNQYEQCLAYAKTVIFENRVPKEDEKEKKKKKDKKGE